MRGFFLKAFGVLAYTVILGWVCFTFWFTPWRWCFVGCFMQGSFRNPLMAFVYAMEWSYWWRKDHPDNTPERAAHAVLQLYQRGEYR